MATRSPARNALIPRRVAVLVRQRLDNNTHTPKIVWQHEVPLLEAIHGEGNVTDIPNDKLNEHFKAKASADLLPWNKSQDAFMPPSDALGVGFVFTGNLEAEYERLASVWGKHPEINVTMVEHVYGRFQTGKFAELFQPGSLEDMPVAQLRQVIRGHGYVPIVDKDSTAEQRKEAETRHRELGTATRERLLELAQEIEAAYA